MFFNLKVLLNSWDLSRDISLQVLASWGTNFYLHPVIMARSAPLSSFFLVRGGGLYISCLKKYCNTKHLTFFTFCSNYIPPLPSQAHNAVNQPQFTFGDVM